MYTAKNFTHLLGTPGLSDTLLTNHFTLYEGYVKNTKALIELMKTKEAGTPDYAELHRRFGWEWNGMRLHELYFGNLSRHGVPLSDRTLKKMIIQSWGSVEAWEKEFRGIASMRGIGWAVLAYDKKENTLFNLWIGEHDGGHLAGLTPLLVLDVFEHAFMLDYGIKRADYIEASMKVIDWHAVEERV